MLAYSYITANFSFEQSHSPLSVWEIYGLCLQSVSMYTYGTHKS